MMTPASGIWTLFRPLPIKHITLQMLTQELPAASLALAELGIFNPDSRDGPESPLTGIPGRRYREIHQQALERLRKIAPHIQLPPADADEAIHPVSEPALKEASDWLGEAWQVCSEYEEQYRGLLDERHGIEQLQRTLSNFRKLKVDLGQLNNHKGFLDVHIGLVPQEHVRQLRDALGLDGYLLYIYMQKSPNSHVVIIGLGAGKTPHLRSVLDTAGYRDIELPRELQTRPDKAAKELLSRLASVERRLHELQTRFGQWCREAREPLQQTARILRLAGPYVALGQAARNRGSLAQINGWVPAGDIPQLRRTLQEKMAAPFVLSARDPTREEHPLVPSVVRHNRWLQPFSILVQQYGVPRYDELNPTIVFALTFVCLFGLMLGDVGHGAVIVCAALLARRRLGVFSFFALAAGASSMLFGFLYGSLFGYEHIIQASWVSPLSEPKYMLGVALICGVGFLSLSTLLNIFNLLLLGERLGALFSRNGLFSLLFYLGLVGSAYPLFAKEAENAIWPSLAVISLLCLFIYNLLEHSSSLPERILVALIETFETVIGYISNSLSFLRVAAFSLNHVALAIAVFTLANSMHGMGHWLMVIFGNLFILVLEGAIVTIQVLRLEYYEGFTRFYAGDGRAFRPLKL